MKIQCSYSKREGSLGHSFHLAYILSFSFSAFFFSPLTPLVLSSSYHLSLSSCSIEDGELEEKDINEKQISKPSRLMNLIL